MAKSLKEAIKGQRDSLKMAIRYAETMRKRCVSLNIDKYFKVLVRAEPKANLFVGSYSIIITIPVVSMKHMMEAIEAAEICMGIEFDKSEDYPASGERNFTSSKNWGITIKAQIPLEQTDGQTCTRVQVGTKTVDEPVYELQCAD